MKRYIKLYFVYLDCAIKGRLEYKKDAVIGIFSFLIANLISFLSLMFVVNAIPDLNGWNKYELGFLYGFSMLPRAVDHMFTDSIWYVGHQYVRKGIIDRFLIRPVNILFQVIAEIFQPEAFGELIMGVLLLVACGRNITIEWSFSKVVMALIAIFFGAVVFSAIKLITASVAFWTKRSAPLMSMVYNFADFAKYPIQIYHPAVRMIMMFIIPFGLVISIPADVLLHGSYSSWLVSLVIILVATVFWGIGCFIWIKGLRQYESSGN